MKQTINPRKAAIIGCGFVGSATAFTLMQSRLFSELVLLDANEDKADGEAKDIAHGIPFAGQMKIYAGTYDDIADSAIIIVTAGANQKPNETRLDLVHKNVAIYKTIIPEIAKRGFEGILLIVSNPVDILTYAALKLSGFPETPQLFQQIPVFPRFQPLPYLHLPPDLRMLQYVKCKFYFLQIIFRYHTFYPFTSNTRSHTLNG